jgi:phosphoglycerate dehydrogenase-like enzyme
MRPRGLYVLDRAAFDLAYGPQEQQDIAQQVEILGPVQSRHTIRDHPELLGQVQVLFSGWGAPRADDAFLDAAPKLKAIFYAGGGVGSWITPAVWERNVIVSSAYAANAVPVAEYALAMILFSLKHGWSLAREVRERRTFPPRDGAPGCYGTTVGLLSLGVTARRLVNLLRPFEMRILAHDPYVSKEEAATLGVEPVSLDELFRRADIVSIHTPLLDETIGLVTAAHVASMKRGATLINTARGQIIREQEVVQVLASRGDLQAVLDVTDQEPPAAGSPLYTLPNVVLTPHIAGSVGRECRRMGRYMVQELHRYLAGQPLCWRITPEMAQVSSHRPHGESTLTLPPKRRAKGAAAALR